MRIKKVFGKVHLWLGLLSGLLVLFLGLTGCILVFEKEIESWLQPYQHVQKRTAAYLPPSKLRSLAEEALGKGRRIVSIEYGVPGRAAMAYYYNAEEYFLMYLNPYTGELLKVKDMHHDFFRFVVEGHYNLWLPRAIGQPIVASGTLIFVVLMITGLVLWWPKSKSARKQRFRVKWSAKWRRVNYDLHGALGFYMTFAGIFIALSGLVMGFQWFAKTVYWVSSGGEKAPEFVPISSDTTKAGSPALKDPTDLAWQHSLALVKNTESIFATFPADAKAVVMISINHRPGTYYKQDSYYFDQYSQQPLYGKGIFDGSYARAPAAHKVSRMNYDIHVGAIGGLFTKLLAFFGSLFCASLPVTGFLIWLGRRKKGKKGAAPVSSGKARSRPVSAAQVHTASS